MKHFWPIFIKTSILLGQPRIISHFAKVRRIPHNERKGIIFKRKSCEIALNIGVYNTTSFRLTFHGFPDAVHFRFALVCINSGGMIFVKPNRTGSTGNIKYFLFHQPSPPFSAAAIPCITYRAVGSEIPFPHILYSLESVTASSPPLCKSPYAAPGRDFRCRCQPHSRKRPYLPLCKPVR